MGHLHIRKNRRIDYVGELHLELILRFGGVPIIIPRIEGMKNFLEDMGEMHGLLLVEGEDISPTRYGQEGPGKIIVQEPDLGRDDVEFELVSRALAAEVPILGICRGCHVLNIASGGSLFADVKQNKNSNLDHISLNPDTYDSYRHHVRIQSSGPMTRWYEKEEMDVNSFHHQGVKDLGSGLVPLCFSDDGLVEAFYHPDKKFRVGIQFHPERMLQEEPNGNKIYQDFIQAAKEYQASTS